MDDEAIIALFKSKIANWTQRSHQKRPSAVNKGREGYHGGLVRAADIKKGRQLSKKAVGCQKRLSAVKKAVKAFMDV